MTLVTISCCTLRGGEEKPQLEMRMKGRGEDHVIPVCISQNSFR